MTMIGNMIGKGCRRFGSRLPVALAAAFCLLQIAAAARAQSIDFQVGNISLEQVVSAAPQSPSPEVLAVLDDDAPQTTNTVILQHGTNNTASASTSGSPGSAIAALQLGDKNDNYAVILDSPGSKIGSVQIGTNNPVVTGIFGGSDNTIGTAQVGSGLGMAVGLVNSESTTVVYGQAGKDYNGGVVIKNAPPGTVVRLN